MIPHEVQKYLNVAQGRDAGWSWAESPRKILSRNSRSFRDEKFDFKKLKSRFPNNFRIIKTIIFSRPRPSEWWREILLKKNFNIPRLFARRPATRIECFKLAKKRKFVLQECFNYFYDSFAFVLLRKIKTLREMKADFIIHANIQMSDGDKGEDAWFEWNKARNLTRKCLIYAVERDFAAIKLSRAYRKQSRRTSKGFCLATPTVIINSLQRTSSSDGALSVL